MLDTHFSPAQKASIVTSILREQQIHGADLRDCCRAQGLTVQTFLNWKNQALRHQAFDLHLAQHEEVDGNRVEPAPRARRTYEAPKTAIQLALERAQAAAEDDGEAPPEPEPTVEPTTQAAPRPEEPETMPKADAVPPQSPMAATLAKHFPWLAKLDERTTAKVGFDKPTEKKTPEYMQWMKTRTELMTDKQREAWKAFYNRGGTRPSAAEQAAEQTELAAAIAANATAPKKRGRPRKVYNGASGPLSTPAPQAATEAPTLGPEEPRPTVAELVEQQHRLDNAIQSHPAHGPFALVRAQPGNGAEAELDRLRRALAVLTLENLQLRGLL